MTNKVMPIAIDLGAKNTGVYTALYPHGSQLNNIKDKSGKVYQLDKNQYTILKEERTAKRHQRRGFNRAQLVKRLMKLIWVHSWHLEWSDDIQQAISFLLNRRGFSFLEEQYNPDYLNMLPQEAKIILRPIFNVDQDNLNSFILSLIQEDTEGFNQIYKQIKEKVDTIQQILAIDNAIGIRLENKVLNVKFDKKLNILEKISYQQGKRLFPMIVDEIELNKFNELELIKYFNTLDQGALSKIRNNLSIQTLDASESNWNFNIDTFDVNHDKNITKLEQGHCRTHLHHLAFSLNNIHNELLTGSRHRNQYFIEIKRVLEKNDHKEGYLNRFVQDLNNHKYMNVNANMLLNLIGNLSNMELKPLRKYFNDVKHAINDYWDENRFAEIYCRWILGEWRVGAKDKDKQPQAKYCYKTLCNNLKLKVGTTQDIIQKTSKGSIITFLINLHPAHTVPPYQDNNNRNTPKCQSLILNPKFLDKAYPDWLVYLYELKTIPDVKEYLGDYKEQLAELLTSKGKKYFVKSKPCNRNNNGLHDDKDLAARELQFIFDRVKANDLLLLNQIYSIAKKIKQMKNKSSDQLIEELNALLIESKLINSLKSVHDKGVFPKLSFLHLVCKYYKQRQRARDGRLFIMPEYIYNKAENTYHNTARFNDTNLLLTYCNHKPRQKKYQILNDLAGILQTPPHIIIKTVGSKDDQAIFEWIRSFKIQSYCKNASELQQRQKGNLKTVIAESKEIKKLQENIDKAANKIGEALGLQEIQVAKFNSIFSFVQLENVIFRDRNGYGSTCVVCSCDNINRTIISHSMAKAQRLPAIVTRVIDGGFKTMANILARTITDDNWIYIETVLTKDEHLHIPIITESNTFLFEPSLAELKGNKLNKKRENRLKDLNPEVPYTDKEERIYQDSKGISAYSGEQLSTSKVNCENDHIIPRSSKQFGILNDESNLICVNKTDNQYRGNAIYTLSNLADNYKIKQFGFSNNDKIEEWIADKIWDSSRKTFSFGKYLSFANLANQDQRTAFRHALFLPDDHEIKKEVIKAIQNRNRAFVNGTQRYFAEVLANKIYLKAIKHKLPTNKLSFDYFGIRAEDIYELRKKYENYNYLSTNDYKKEKNISQKSYSHLLDATLAFCIAVDAHKNEGSLGVYIDDSFQLKPIDKTTGEVYNDILNNVRILENQMDVVKLTRRATENNFVDHRPMTRDTIYAERYLSILIHKESDMIRQGFTWDNSIEIKINKKNTLQNILDSIIFVLQFVKYKLPTEQITYKTLSQLRDFLSRNNFPCNDKYFYIHLETNLVHAYFIKHYNTTHNVDKNDQLISFLINLTYKTERKAINTKQDVDDIRNNKKNFIIQGKIDFPGEQEWDKLSKAWDKNHDLDDLNFLQKYFCIKNNLTHHYKVRNKFSLPVITLEGKFIICRKSWTDKPIYQLLNDSDSRIQGVKPFKPALIIENNKRVKVLSNNFKSKNIYFLSTDKDKIFDSVDNKKIISLISQKWIQINIPEDLSDYNIKSIFYKVLDITNVEIKLTLQQEIGPDQLDTLLESPYLKPKKNLETVKTHLIQSLTAEYTISGQPNCIMDRYSKILVEKFHETSSST